MFDNTKRGIRGLRINVDSIVRVLIGMGHLPKDSTLHGAEYKLNHNCIDIAITSSDYAPDAEGCELPYLSYIPLGLDKVFAIRQATIGKALCTVVARGIKIPSYENVCHFLIHNPDAVEAMLVLCETTAKEFSADSQLSLESYAEAEGRHLTLYVRQEHYDDKIMNRIEATWIKCEEIISDKSGWIHITTDFQPPMEE
jgi:hypothetical protein